MQHVRRRDRRARTVDVRVFSDRVVDRIVDAIAKGNTYEATAAAGRISERTFHERMGRAEKDAVDGLKDSPFVAFAERVEAANLQAERTITELWVSLIPTDWRAARDFLEPRFPARWRRAETRMPGAWTAAGISLRATT
jgi:hypothetical protein